MKSMTECVCEYCGGKFNKLSAEIKRTKRNFCSKACTGAKRAADNVARFYERCEKTPKCWNWTGSKNRSGYGVARLGIPQLAHRASYEISFGPIPEGLCVMHSCDNPACVNPAHLSLGTHADNMRDMSAKQRRHTKLSIDDVLAIRASSEKTKDLAVKYRVCERSIRNARSPKGWPALSSTPPSTPC